MLRTKGKIEKTIASAAFLAVAALLGLSGRALGESNLTQGHQVLLEKGLQIQALAMPYQVINDGGTFNVDLFRQSGFTTINIWQYYSYDAYVNHATGEVLPSGANALKFSKLVSSSTEAVCSATYLPNLVSVQLKDEQSIIPTTAHPNILTTMATEVAALKAKYPNAIVYTNQSAYYNEDADGTNAALTVARLNTYIQTVKPDMLSFTEYPFRYQGMLSTYAYDGGSPRYMYYHMETYRQAGLAGLDGTGAKPIPVSMFVQTYAHVSSACNGRQPTESEFRLQQFAGWAAGFKSAIAYIYNHQSTSQVSMFFTGTDRSSQAPTTQFHQYAELNRQSKNLGNALVRLVSTNFFMKMGRHFTDMTYAPPGAGGADNIYTNAKAPNVTEWSYNAGSATDPYLTGMTATNLGTCNGSSGTSTAHLEGDIILGYFKPLDSSLVAKGCENDIYFMIVNGLTDGTASTAAECRQLIHLTFDFGTSGIDGLLRLSRDTGLVEEVALLHDSGSIYSLDLTLDGGTGDLFKYDTGTAFIGTTNVPEPSSLCMCIACLLCGGGMWMAARRKKAFRTASRNAA